MGVAFSFLLTNIEAFPFGSNTHPLSFSLFKAAGNFIPQLKYLLIPSKRFERYIGNSQYNCYHLESPGSPWARGCTMLSRNGQVPPAPVQPQRSYLEVPM